MPDLSTTYMGLGLRNPLVASASPLSNSVDGVRGLAAAGVGAVVLPSLFEEQARAQTARDSTYRGRFDASFHESLGLFPTVAVRDAGPRRYLTLLERAADAVDVPVIASLNGVTADGWTGYARAMQEAGAAAIELNISYLPGDPSIPGRDVEQRHVDVLAAVRAVVSVPVAVKLGPWFSSPGEIALRLCAAGADALVLFNRFVYPDVDPGRVDIVSGVELSTRQEARMPRTWIALLRAHVGASLAATTGVEEADDVVAYLLAGADVVMSASALIRHGAAYAAELIDGLSDWMTGRNLPRIEAFRGRLAVPAGADAAAYERSGYVTAMRRANVAPPGQPRPAP
jgi:dihydroorotate dehydrogenase (fumarate)